jgi:hypothetical protein
MRATGSGVKIRLTNVADMPAGHAEKPIEAKLAEQELEADCDKTRYGVRRCGGQVQQKKEEGCNWRRW